MLAGHVAERVALGEYLIGSGSDLGQAESRLRFLTLHQGAYGYESIVGSSCVRYDIISDNNAKAAYCKIVTDKLNMLDSKAEDIIRKNRRVFDEIVKELMEKQTLTREELLSIKTRYCLNKDSELNSARLQHSTNVSPVTNVPKAG